jgi:superfamily I DNA/RNA helicase
MTPTDEQVAIMDAARTTSKNIMCKAFAGCAKTTTVEMTGRVLPVRPTLYVVFNVRNKKEAEARMPPHIHCKTVNGLGHEAFGRTIGRRLAVDADKIGKILKDTIKFNPEFRDMNKEQFGDVLQLVRRARICGLIPEQFPDYRGLTPDNEEGWQEIADQIWLEINEGHIFLARTVLIAAIKMSFAGTVDYDDQIYMSALFGGVFTKYAEVMVDEAQDLSPLMHIMVSKAAMGRLIIVGDPLQAIYAFRGADSASMEKLRALREDWLDLPLTLTFRCPKLTVARQQSHAPGFRAHEDNKEGEHHFFDERYLPPENKEKKSWDINEVEKLHPSGQIAILCRNNAPIIAAALRIIKGGRGCTVLGREIGKSLVTLSKKILPDDNSTIPQCAERLSKWAERELALAEANGKEAHMAVIRDKAECLSAVLESPLCTDASTLRALLGKMFEGDNLRITLATGHKSKGGEWPCIVNLDPWRIPSKYAIMQQAKGNPVPVEQDLNLRYVIETRSQNITVFANLEEMQ